MNVKQLFEPNAQRIADVRCWFADQSVSDDHVAALSVAITADGMVTTSGCCIEPEHAVVMLDELRQLIKRIEGQLPADCRQSAKVMPLRLVSAG
jgi:hypothetical protein